MNKYLPIIAGSTPTKILGHRGVVKQFQENSMEGFVKALELGIDGVELDVQLTKDDEVVVFHDAHLKRLTGINEKVEDMTWAQLQNISIQSTIDMGNGVYHTYASPVAIPKLSDVLDTIAAKYSINIELKSDRPSIFNKRIGVRVAEVIRERNAQSWVFLSSFDPFMLYGAASILPDISQAFTYHHEMLPLQWLRYFTELPGELTAPAGNQNPQQFINYLAEYDPIGKILNTNMIAIEKSLIDSDTVEKFHRRNISVGTYTFFALDQRAVPTTNTSDEDLLFKLVQQGVDWIETDDPERMQQLLR